MWLRMRRSERTTLEPRRWRLHGVTIVMAALGCSGTNGPASQSTGSGGTTGTTGATGVGATGGVAAGGADQGVTGQGGAPPGGTTGAGGSTSGSAGAATGDSAGAGGTGATGGSGAAGGGGGSGGSGIPGDRCDVAVHDPANPPGMLSTSGTLSPTHDPTVIEQDGTFYLFRTGGGLPGRTSSDLENWSDASAAFSSSTTPWVSEEVPAAGDLWAPDLSYFDGRYHIYYSASSFRANDSCIGHATRDSMDSGNWTDHGSVHCTSGSDNYNAIDPNIIVDIDGSVWMFFGSHWDGIKAIELDPTGMTTMGDLYDIAARPQAPRAIEAPVVVRRCGYYYLFVSFDQCCGNWTDAGGVPYNIRVGRSESLLGPYVDKDGTPMYPDGGGTLLVGPGGQWDALGHNAVIFAGDRAYNIYHAYNPQTLRVAELVWDAEGWPISGGP